jgi:hypothetical protein
MEPRWALTRAKKRLCTMCTPWASNWVVLVADWAGSQRFSGERWKFEGWNPVRVPPLTGVSAVQWLFSVFRVHIVHALASDLMFRVCAGSRTDPLVGEQLTPGDRVPPCGFPSGCSGFAARAFPPVDSPPQPSFSRHRRIRIPGIRSRCPRCFGGGSWPRCPQSDRIERLTRRWAWVNVRIQAKASGGRAETYSTGVPEACAGWSSAKALRRR